MTALLRSGRDRLVDMPRAVGGGGDANEGQVGWLDGAVSGFGRSYTGEPDRIAEELAKDAAVRAADTRTHAASELLVSPVEP